MHASKSNKNADGQKPKPNNVILRPSAAVQMKQSQSGQQEAIPRRAANGKMAVFMGRGKLQTKLKVGAPNDKFEKEADAVADTVVNRTSEPSIAKSEAPPIQTMRVHSNDLQRVSEPSHDEDEVQMKASEEDAQLKESVPVQRAQEDEESVQMETDPESEVQLKETAPDPIEIQKKAQEVNVPETPIQKKETLPIVEPPAPKPVARPVQLKAEAPTEEEVQLKEEEVSDEREAVQLQSKTTSAGDNPDISSQIASSKGGGNAMSEGIKSEMESSFGRDFSDVKIHTDSKAAEMNQQLGAKAFTNGSDVYFNKGNYDPNSKDGKHLLAHELTHTLQQGGGQDLNVQRKVDPETLQKISALAPAAFAKLYFADDPDYSWSKLKQLFYTGGDGGENTKVKQFLIRNEFTWAELIDEFEFNSAKNFIHILDVNGKVYISAPTVGLAYFALQSPEYGLNYPRDVGWWFYYTDGVSKPYRLGYGFDYTPSEDQLNTINGSVGDLYFPNREAILHKDVPKKELGQLYEQVNKELGSKLDWLAKITYKDPKNEVYVKTVNELQVKYCKDHNIPYERQVPRSKFDQVGFAIEYGVIHRQKNRIIGNLLSDDGYYPEDGSVEQFVEFQSVYAEGKETELVAAYEELTAKYLKKYEAEITEWNKPYVKILEDKKAAIDAELKKQLESSTTTKEFGEWKEAAELEFLLLKKAVVEEAAIAFSTSSLWQKIAKEIEPEFKPIQDKILEPDLVAYVEKLKDPALLGMVKSIDAKFKSSQPQKGKNGYYYKSDATFKSVDELSEGIRSKYWEHIRPYMEKKNYSIDVINEVYRIYYYQYSKLLFFTKDGEQTPYMLRRWAITMRNRLNNLRAELQEKHKYFPDQLPGTSAYFDALTDLQFEVGYAIDHLNQIVNHPEKSEGFMNDFKKGLNSLSAYDYIPFLRSLFSLSKMSEMGRIQERIDAGIPISPTEELLLTSFGALQQIQQMQPGEFGFNVGKGVSNTLVILSEVVVLNPVTSIGTTIGRNVALKYLESYMKKRIVRIFVKGVGKLSGALFMTMANPLRVIDEAEKMGMFFVGLQLNEDGSMTAMIQENPEADNPLNLFKAFASIYVTNLTEIVGGRVFSAIGKGVGRFLPTKIANSVFAKSVLRTKAIFEKYNFNGLGEYEEEVYDNVLQALLRGEAPEFNFDEQLEIFTTVVIIGGGAKGIQLSIAGFQYVNTFKMDGNTVTLSPKVMDGLSLLVETKAQEQFEAQLQEWLDTDQISAAEFNLAMRLSGEVMNQSHQIEAEKESLKNQIMRGSVTDLQTEYAAYQEVYAQLETIKHAYQNGNAEASYQLRPEGASLSLEIDIANEAEVDLWMQELHGAMSLMESVALMENNEISSVEKIEESDGSAPFIEIDIDIAQAIESKYSHIGTVELKTRDGITFRVTGIHTELAANEIYIVTTNNRGRVVSSEKSADYTMELQDINEGSNGVYEAKIVIKDLAGNIVAEKSGNNGFSTFFPKDWTADKIKQEVEYAIRNNRGFANGTNANDGYYGYSSDGKVRIEFYYRESTNQINSYFPSLNHN